MNESSLKRTFRPLRGWNKSREATIRRVGRLALLGLLATACSSPEPGRKPDVVLITIDTLRRDHIGIYGSTTTRTPHIDKLALEGLLFTNAATPMPLTRPAHFSLFTSLYPREHGVLNNALALPTESNTLAERFRENGYATAGFVGVALLSPESGGDQGFETFSSPARPKGTADEIIPKALSWVANQPKNQPLFLWIHLFDPHLPYDPPPDFRGEVDSQLEKAFPKLNWKQLKDIAAANDGNVPKEVLEYGQALYRGEIEHTDHWIGRLLDGLTEERGLDETLIALTADHGECFEHGIYFEHSDCLYEGAIAIPLIFRYPAAFTAGSRNATQVSLLDVAPTLLAAAGLPPLESVSGSPIQALPMNPERYTLLQYPMYQPDAANSRSKKGQTIRSVAGQPARSILLASEMTGAVGRDWKLLRGDQGLELYATGADSRPELDRSSAEPETRARMEAQLDSLLEEHPMNVIDAKLINEEMRQTLEALGYIHSTQ